MILISILIILFNLVMQISMGTPISSKIIKTTYDYYDYDDYTDDCDYDDYTDDCDYSDESDATSHD